MLGVCAPTTQWIPPAHLRYHTHVAQGTTGFPDAKPHDHPGGILSSPLFTNSVPYGQMSTYRDLSFSLNPSLP